MLKIIEIQYLDKDGNVVWEKKDLHNMLHNGGEDFILQTVFVNPTKPDNYYFRLDARNPQVTDTIQSINGEPVSNPGYVKIAVPSSGQFQSSVPGQVMGPVLSFGATGSPYTITNLLLATSADNNLPGVLICTIPLGSITIAAGDRITMRMSVTLGVC